MKKKIIALFVLVLMSSLALAQQGIHEPGTGIEDPEMRGTGQGLDATQTAAQNQANLTQLRNRIQTEEALGQQERQRLQTGLENALTKVNNTRAREVLTRNLERWMGKYQERMQRMENIEIEEVDEETGEATMKAQEPVKYFGFIQGKATKRFEMNRNGTINERAPWYSIFYTEEE